MSARLIQKSYHAFTFCGLMLLALSASVSFAQDQSPATTAEPEQPFIDEFRDDLAWSVQHTAAWLDSFFGDDIDISEYENTYGRLTLRPEWSGYDGFQVDSSFRASVVLPHAEQQFSAFIGRDTFDDFINDQRRTRPSVIRRDDADEEWMLGLGFAPDVGEQHRLSFSAGFRGGLDLDPYVQSRYTFETIVTERTELLLQTVGFWRDSDGFGVAQTLAHDFAISDKWFNKFWVRGTYAERTEGVRWHASNKVFYMYHPERAIGAEVWWYGETDTLIPLHDHGVRALHRSRLHRDWLYLESWIGMHWPREELTEKRSSHWLVGVELELRFGH